MGRGRPPTAEQPQVAQRYRVVVAVEAVAQAEDVHGWTVWATPVGAEVGSDAEMLPAYHDQHSTVEPGCRWSKHPAAITPVWLEQPERIAAFAMLTVAGLLV